MEPGPLNGLDEAQEATLEQPEKTRPAPERDIAPRPAPDGPGAEIPMVPYDDRLRAMLDTGTYSLSSLKLGTRVPVKELGAAIAYNFV